MGEAHSLRLHQETSTKRLSCACADRSVWNKEHYGWGYNTNYIVVAMLLIPVQELRDDLFVNGMRQAFIIGPHGKIIGRVMYEGFFPTVNTAIN